MTPVYYDEIKKNPNQYIGREFTAEPGELYTGVITEIKVDYDIEITFIDANGTIDYFFLFDGNYYWINVL